MGAGELVGAAVGAGEGVGVRVEMARATAVGEAKGPGASRSKEQAARNADRPMAIGRKGRDPIRRRRAAPLLTWDSVPRGWSWWSTCRDARAAATVWRTFGLAAGRRDSRVGSRPRVCPPGGASCDAVSDAGSPRSALMGRPEVSRCSLGHGSTSCGTRQMRKSCPQRNSNPCFRLERPTSWSTRRWGRGCRHARMVQAH